LKKGKQGKDSYDYVNEVLKKKLKHHRKPIKQNQNKGKAKTVTENDYFF